VKRYPTPSTQPEVTYCRGCRKRCLEALWDALPLILDYHPLSLLGELHASIQGLQTWWLVGEHLYRRHAAVIKESPHGRGGAVLRSHDCNVPPPAGDELAPDLKQRYTEVDF
jgi:hypothetical protein